MVVEWLAARTPYCTGVVAVEHLSTAINFSTVDPMSNILLFSESLKRDLSNDVFQSKISSGP